MSFIRSVLNCLWTVLTYSMNNIKLCKFVTLSDAETAFFVLNKMLLVFKTNVYVSDA